VTPARDHRYDLVVIGAGSAGLVAADFGARFGAEVLLIERNRIGGDCTWTGCIPSKTLLNIAGIAHRVRQAPELGIGTGEVRIDFPKVMGRVREAIATVYESETPERLRERGVAVELGAARFLDREAVEVNGKRIRSRNFVICTGAAPEMPPIKGLASVAHRTYEDVFELEASPRRLLVLGGGPVGVELGQAFSRLGSAVTIVEQGPRLLTDADVEASEMVTARLNSEGVRIETEVQVDEARSDGDGVVLVTSKGPVRGDLLLVATGRRPNHDSLALDRVGVEFDERGIRVDETLKTSQDHIYAAGDVTGSFQFTHYAGWQGFVAVRNALFPGSTAGLRETVPWAVFTDPEVAQIGITEEQARARAADVVVHRLPLDRVDRAATLGETDGLIKILSDETGRLLGATIVAPSAAEVVNEVAVAMSAGVDVQDLGSTMHVYPTIGIAVQQLASAFAVRKSAGGLRGTVSRMLIRRSRW
jgi:pyruvate/2-oxoglutarate dehydrogenase complex dihydrolipoamide dehydrogenase (E3) component